MGFNEFLSSIFGNKSTRDMKEIKPWVEKIKAAYPEVEKLDNDALRAKTEELKNISMNRYRRTCESGRVEGKHRDTGTGRPRRSLRTNR